MSHGEQLRSDADNQNAESAPEGNQDPARNLRMILLKANQGEKQMQIYIITMLLIGFAAILGYLIFTGDKS
jgi:hypothetical protein